MKIEMRLRNVRFFESSDEELNRIVTRNLAEFHTEFACRKQYPGESRPVLESRSDGMASRMIS